MILSSSGDDEGLIARANALFQRLKKEELDPKVRERARFVAKNILIFLNLALDESLHSLSRRQLKAAAEDMLKVYAYLSAALGPESAPGRTSASPPLLPLPSSGWRRGTAVAILPLLRKASYCLPV